MLHQKWKLRLKQKIQPVFNHFIRSIMKRNLSNSLAILNKTILDYFKIRVKLVKLDVLQKMTKMSVFIISTVVFMMLGSIFFLFASTAFVIWFGNTFGNYLTGLLIISGILLLLGIFFYLSRRSLFTSFIIRNLSSILFEEDEDID